MANISKEMLTAIDINRALDVEFGHKGEEHVMTILMLAAAMRARKTSPTNDNTYCGWAKISQESLLDFPEGADYETIALQLREEAH
jgi:hypothetical protein